MAVLSLPLTFTNSFWTQDYRRGLEVLFGKLEQGVAENGEIVAFIRARAHAEHTLAASLTNPMLTGAPGTGFGADDGATLLMAFRGLQGESVAQGRAHAAVAQELDTLVADPFEEWAIGYKERIKKSRATAIDNWLRSYEHSQGEVAKLKHTYLMKVRKADEAEDDAKFAPNREGADNYTTSPRLAPHDRPRAPPQRSASVSDRIAQRLREIQRKAVSAVGVDETPRSPEVLFEEKEKERAAEAEDAQDKERLDKGKGKAPASPQVTVTASPEQHPDAVHASPPPMDTPLPPPRLSVDALPKPPGSPMPPPPPPPLLLAGLSLPPAAVSALLSRAAEQLPLRAVRVPLLGEYQDCFSGEEFVAWLNENVDGFGGSLDRAEDAARDLTEREGLLRRIGDLGNLFEHSDEAYYQFRRKAFELDKLRSGAPVMATSPVRGSFAPVADNALKRAGTFVSIVQKALATNGNATPAHLRARADADMADKEYRAGVRHLDRTRLALEERVEDALKTLQRWELERLRAVKTALLQYQGTLANLPKGLEAANERAGTLLAAYHPDGDLSALIERYRTGPFRPHAEVYESVSHDEADVVFGIDLRRWAEGGWTTMMGESEERKEQVPPVATALLDGVTKAYARLPDDGEKRKAWIYDVPLAAVHHLREALNSVPPGMVFPHDLFEKYDAPVIAAAAKLWLLELDPPLALWEGWDEIRKLYPTVGSAGRAAESAEEERVRDLGIALQRLPKVHLFVLDMFVSHLRNLIDTTTTEEPNETYINKLALSVGRTILRPRFETEITVQDRHPTLLFIDLINHYTEIIPPTIARKKRESDRKMPVRKRTKPVDMRLSRSKINMGDDVQELLAAQNAKKAAVPPVPPMPVGAKAAVPPLPPAAAAPAPTPVVPAEPAAPTESAVPAKAALDSVPPPPPLPAAANPDEPPRPAFKEPPPEDDDDLPPRPSFKEPPPESPSPPPMPKFAEPPAEDDGPADAPSPPQTATPPTPQGAKASSPNPLRRMSGSHATSRSPSPPVGASGLTRSGSGQKAGAVRGPRISRGPRAPGGGGLAGGLNRAGSPAGSRPTSMVGGRPGSSGGLARRTMASDAEDEVVEK